MPRYDQSSKHKLNIDQTWEAAQMRNNMKNVDEQRLQELLQVHANIASKRGRGEMTPEEQKEYDMTMRVARIGSSTPDRYQDLIKKEGIRRNKEAKLAELMRKKFGGQSEEEFQEEIDQLRQELKNL